jgi:predicted nucleic acid-binding protein
MPNSSIICVDANLVVRRVTDPNNAVIQEVWNRWAAEHVDLNAPSLLGYEVTNALYRLQRAGDMSPATIQRTLAVALSLPITLHGDSHLHIAALGFAGQFGLSASYDAHYLAVAQRLDGEFWTTDERLVNTVRHVLPWVRLVK